MNIDKRNLYIVLSLIIILFVSIFALSRINALNRLFKINSFFEQFEIPIYNNSSAPEYSKEASKAVECSDVSLPETEKKLNDLINIFNDKFRFCHQLNDCKFICHYILHSKKVTEELELLNHILQNFESDLSLKQLLDFQDKLIVLKNSISPKNSLKGQSYYIRTQKPEFWSYPVLWDSTLYSSGLGGKLFSFFDNRVEHNRVKLLQDYKTVIESMGNNFENESSLIKYLEQNADQIVQKGNQKFWYAYLSEIGLVIFTLKEHAKIIVHIDLLQESIEDLIDSKKN